MTHEEAIDALEQALVNVDGLAFAVLIGSRATNRVRPESDWDIAVQWLDLPRDPLDQFARDETLVLTLVKARRHHFIRDYLLEGVALKDG